MQDSPEAAEYRTNLSGWVSSKGHYFGRDERAARHDGSTHHKCDCGGIAERSYTCCPTCRRKNSVERFFKKEPVEWDGVTPLVLYDDDRYFFNDDDLIEYCGDNDTQPESLMLVLCEPVYLPPIWYEPDDMPEDYELPQVVIATLEHANRVIQAYNDEKPRVWEAGEKRIIYHSNS